MSARDPIVRDGALRAVAAWARDVMLRPVHQRGAWMQRILAVLTPAALAAVCEELLKRRKEARGGAEEEAAD